MRDAARADGPVEVTGSGGPPSRSPAEVFGDHCAEGDGARVEDGADSFVIRDGRIVAESG